MWLSLLFLQSMGVLYRYKHEQEIQQFLLFSMFRLNLNLMPQIVADRLWRKFQRLLKSKQRLSTMPLYEITIKFCSYLIKHFSSPIRFSKYVSKFSPCTEISSIITPLLDSNLEIILTLSKHSYIRIELSG